MTDNDTSTKILDHNLIRVNVREWSYIMSINSDLKTARKDGYFLDGTVVYSIKGPFEQLAYIENTERARRILGLT